MKRHRWITGLVAALVFAGLSLWFIGQALSFSVVTTIPVGSNPYGVAVNATTNRIYVGNSNSVSVINGADNTVINTIEGSAFGDSIAVNENTNTIYVTDNGWTWISVINGQNNAVTMLNLGDYPATVAVNATTNRVYAASQNTVLVIDGGAGTVGTTLRANGYPEGIAVNPATNKVYIVVGSGQLHVLDG